MIFFCFIMYFDLCKVLEIYILFNDGYINKSFSLSMYVLLCTHFGTSKVMGNGIKLDVISAAYLAASVDHLLI